MERSETVKDTENNIKVNADNADQSADAGASSSQNPVNQPGASTASSEGFSASTQPTDDGGTKIKVIIRDTDQSSDMVPDLPQVGGGDTREAVTEKDRKRELNNKKKEYQKKRQVSRGIVNLGSPVQELPANALPEDINEEQQSRANRLMRRSKIRRQNNPARTGQIIPEYSNGLSGQRNLDNIPSDQENSDENEEDGEGDEQPLNISEGEENDTEQQLDEQRNESKNEKEKDSAFEITKNNLESLANVAESGSLPKAIVEALKTGIRLRQQINNHRDSTYFIALLFAVIKDATDILTLSLLSWVDWTVDIFLVITLRIFLLFRSTWKIKLLLWIAALIEIIPTLDLVPTWSITVLYVWIKAVRENNERKKKLNEVEKQIGKGKRKR
ncbi:MAG: hypothetical protein WC693_04635 [Patescibacteria group bacterium]|jgi:hypothetical protein